MRTWSLYVSLLGKVCMCIQSAVFWGGHDLAWVQIEFHCCLHLQLLHHGSLINLLLPIVELGFKNPAPEVKCHAYRTWRRLIDNFALNPGKAKEQKLILKCVVEAQAIAVVCALFDSFFEDIIRDHKRVKLLMQVFRINNAKVEMVAVEKMRVWWHFIVQLRDGASTYFEQVSCFFSQVLPSSR